MNAYIQSSVAARLVLVHSEEPLTSPRIVDGEGMEAARLIEHAEENGKHIYRFDASRLTLWTPDTPALYFLDAAEGRIRFGFREFTRVGNREILLNGAPVFLRGYIRGITAHEHPNMTGGTLKDAAVKNIRQAKKFGFNLVRFHSTIPTRDFVDAADEEGLLIHMEIGFAYDCDEKGRKKNLAMDNRAWRETILKYRNDPAIFVFCIGNEMHNSGHYPEVQRLYELGKSLAPCTFIMDNSGWGEFDRRSADVYSQHIAYYYPYKHHAEMFRSDACWHLNGSAYDTPMQADTDNALAATHIRREAVPLRPVLAHEAIHYIEIPDYDALNRKFDDFAAKVGPAYLEANDIRKPRFMEELPALIRQKGLQDRLPDYIQASQQFKMMGIKTYIERLRLSRLNGFEMLQFADCLKYENKNGIVDCFDDDKYIPAPWMREFNSDAVLLADLPDEVFFEDAAVHCDLYISNFLPAPELLGTLAVTLSDGTDTAVLYQGEKIAVTGGLAKLAALKITPKKRGAAIRYTLEATYTAGDVKLHNSWVFRTFPRPAFNSIPALRLQDQAIVRFLQGATAATTQDAVFTDRFDDAVFEDLAQGKTVILNYRRDRYPDQYLLEGALERFKPCIWDRGSNLGGIVYSDFLRERLASGRYFDEGWQPLLEGGFKVNLDDFPAPVNAIVSGVDKPVRDRMKGLLKGVKHFIAEDTLRDFSHLFSVKVGAGTLVVCTFNLDQYETNPVVRNFLAAILDPKADFATDRAIAPEALKAYCAAVAQRGPRKEDVMNHFWEIDNKPVEDTLFWEEAGLDLTKIR